MKKVFSLVFVLFFFSCSLKKSDVRKGVITIALENYPISLDPRIGTDQVSQRLHQLLFRGLLKRNKDGSLSPDIAETYRRKGDRTFIFKLKRGIKFCNGKEITPEDVAYTYNSLLNGEVKSVRAGALWMLRKVYTKGNEVIFLLKRPYSSFLINTVLGIVPKDMKGVMGSGPYCLGSLEKDRIFLKPNPYQNLSANSGIMVRIIPDEVTRALELESGHLDIVVNGFSPDTLYELSRRKGLKIVREKGGNFAYIGINFSDRVLKNKKIRLAIGYGIDRESIIKDLLRGYATPANTVLPPYLIWYEPDVFKFTYNPSLSRLLLKEAGYNELNLDFRCASTRLSRQLAQILKYQLSKVGINLKIDCGEFSYFYSQVIKGNFQLYFLMWVGISDPDIFRFIYHSSSIPPHGANRGRYVNPEMDRLIESGEETYDPDKRREIYSKIQKIAASDVVYIPLWYPDSVAVFKRGLKGVVVYPNGDLIFLKNVHY